MSGAGLLERARAAAAAADPSPGADREPDWLGPGWREVRGIGPFVDHTLLRPDATRDEIARLCEEALRHEVAAVCVNGCWTALCAGRLAATPVRVAVVVGFPLGASRTEVKAAEAARAVGDGAAELDMVVSLGHVRAGDWDYVARDVEAVVRAAEGRVVKAILETASLQPLEAAAAALAATGAGARYVKTSTGFHPAGGAAPEAVRLLRRAVGSGLGVKASGGIRTAEQALGMLAAGASRIGTSSAPAMASLLGTGAPRLGELLAPLRDRPATP